MQTLQKKFHFKFVHHNKKVFVVSKKIYKNETFFSIPIKLQHDKDVVNTIYSSLCPYLSKVYYNLYSNFDEVDSILLTEYSLDDLIYKSSVLRLPLITIVNSYCSLENQDEIYEVFYSYKRYENMEIITTSHDL